MSNFIEDFRNSEWSKRLANILSQYNDRKINIMEVCGTHTMSIFKYGIRNILNEKINIISGPGCPVCVTPTNYIDAAVDLSRKNDIIIATFGDMFKIPGTNSSLSYEKLKGADIRIVYSPLDVLKIANENKEKNVVFLSVGFETTTPAISLTVQKAKEENIKNFFLLVSNKTIPEALEVISSDKEINVNGYIYPGHVSAILGIECYNNIADKYGIPGVVLGFEPMDILAGIIKLTELILKREKKVLNLYSRVVRKDGNQLAKSNMYRVFNKADSIWRGFGNIKESGLVLNSEFKEFDANKFIDIDSYKYVEYEGCQCGDILKGKIKPTECSLFGNSCTTGNPIGPCMVSSEGTCAAYYKYGGVFI